MFDVGSPYHMYMMEKEGIQSAVYGELLKSRFIQEKKISFWRNPKEKLARLNNSIKA